MKIDDRYEIRMVIAQLVTVDYSMFKHLGNIYQDLEEFKKDNPNSECKFGVDYKIGFVIFDAQYGHIPDNCRDWYSMIEEAMDDYNNNCL